jgi:hypothetical protein
MNHESVPPKCGTFFLHGVMLSASHELARLLDNKQKKVNYAAR